MREGLNAGDDSRTLRVANLLLRAASMGIKLVTVVALARFLGVEDFATFGLFLATVTLSLYLVGLDFYAFSQRELIAAPPQKRGWVTKQHLVVMLVSAMCILPFIGFAQAWLPLGSALAPWLLVIVFLEHMGQETVRVLVACAAPLEAGVVIALRTAAWGPPVLLLMYRYESLATLETVFAAWTVGGVLALAYATYCIRLRGLGGWADPVQSAWVRRGFLVALPLLAATVALRLLFTLDRYVLEWLGDLERLAAYTLFVTLAGGLIGLADATFNVFSYPVLVDAHGRGDRRRFLGEFRGFLRSVAAFALGGSAILYVCLPLLQTFLTAEAYRTHAGMFPWVLAGVSLYLLSTVVHYGLFAARRDKSILLANVAALLCLPLGVLALRHLGAAETVPIAMCFSFIMLLLLKSIFLVEALKKNAIAT
jgi:O-antigen/teichoic acid export membrane protein